MPRKGEKLSEEARAKMKARWAEKRSAAVQVKTDAVVTETHTAVNSERLQSIREQIEAAKDTLAKQLSMNASAQKVMKSRTDELNDLYKQAEHALERVHGERKMLETEINERTLYKEQQEKAIEAVVEKGNDRLYEVDQEVKEIIRKRDELNTEMADLERQGAMLEQRNANLGKECAAEDEKLEALKLRYNLTAKKYRDDLMSTKVLITDEQEALDVLRARAKQVTDELIAKGNMAIARESAIAARDAELTSRERLLKSRESRYA